MNLTNSATDHQIAVALADAAALAARLADRDALAADADFVAASVRLDAAGLSYTSSAAQIAAAYDNTTLLTQARAARDLLPPVICSTLDIWRFSAAANSRACGELGWAGALSSD